MAIEFDEAANEYVSLPDHADMKPTTDITLALWLYYNDAVGTTPYVWSCTTGGGHDIGYRLYIIEDGGGADHHLVWRVGWGGGGVNWYTANADYQPYWAGWSHIVATYSTADIIRLYVDGVAFDTGGGGNAIDYTAVTNAYLSCVSGPANYLPGQIFDARLYNRALSLAEVESLYHGRGSDGIVNGLKGRWLMNEAADGVGVTAVPDVSGNDHDGVPVNIPLYRAAPMRISHPRTVRG